MLGTILRVQVERVPAKTRPPKVWWLWWAGQGELDLDLVWRAYLQAGTVTCPARVTVAIRPARQGGGRAWFGRACSVCPLRAACTTSVRGRVVAIHPYEAELAGGRARQRDPAWLADYRATRPKVERKLAHLLRRRHGGRRARVRGLVRVAHDFKLLAAAVNLARLATLGLCSTANGWQVQPA